MDYSIVIDQENRIIRYKHSGEIEREDLGTAWQELLMIKEFTELGYSLLSDYRNSVFLFNLNDTKVIEDFLLSIQHILKGKKEGVIVDNPFSTAVSVYFQSKLQKMIGFEVKVFSTEKAALDWLVYNTQE